MSIIPAKKYESLQKERFDTLFNDVLTSYALTNETSHQLKATRVLVENLNDQINELNKQFEHALIRYGKDYSAELGYINSQHQEAIKREESLYADSLKDLKSEFQASSLETTKSLDALHQKFQKVISQTNINIKRALIDMKQQHQELDFEYDSAKKAYKNAITKLEDKRVSRLAEDKLVYEKNIKENKSQEQIRLYNLNQELQKLAQERQIEQQDFDESVIKIKTIFNRVTIKFNQKIIQYQKAYNQKIDLLKLQIQTSIKTLNQNIDELKKSYSDIDFQILEKYKANALKYEKRSESLTKAFHLSIDEITSAYTKDISVNNSRLATFKEANQNQLRELEKLAAEQRLALNKKNEEYGIELAIINQNYLKEKRVLEQSLRSKIKSTFNENKKRSKQNQKTLLDNEFKFIKAQETLKLKSRILDSNRQHDLNLSKLNFTTEYQSLMAKTRLLERQLFLFNQTTQKEDQGPAIYPYESEALLINNKSGLNNENNHTDTFKKNQALDIYLYESEVLLSREIYDTEMNYRTLENNHFKQRHSLEERKTNLSSDLESIRIRNSKDKLTLINDKEAKQANVVCYLNMEYEKNSLNGFKKIIDEKKKESEIYYQKQELNFFYHKDIEKEIRTNDQKIANFRQRLNLQLLEIKENKALIDHDATTELAKSNYTKEIGIRKARRIIDTSLNETQRQRRIFDIYFQMLLAVIQEQENFVSLFRDIYQTSNENEFIASLPHLETIIAEQKRYKDGIIESLETEAISYYQEKINELTAFKYMNLQESIIEDYESEHKIYSDEIFALETQLKSIRKKSADLFQQIAVLQNSNDNIASTKTFIYKQIQQMKAKVFSKQEKKTISNLRKEIKTLQKDIIKNNADIKHIRMQIRQAFKEMHIINGNFKPLKKNLTKIENNRFFREKHLKRNQYLEGKVYYDAISSIKKLMKQIAHAINYQYQGFETTLVKAKDRELTAHQFNRHYKGINRRSLRLNRLMQRYHRNGVKLCDKQHIDIKKEQLRIIHEYERSYRLTSNNIRITTEKRQIKMLKKSVELEKYKQSFLSIQAKQLQNQKNVITLHFKEKMKQLDEQLKQAAINIQKAIENKNELLVATKSNTDMVVSAQNSKIKHALIALDQTYTKQQKDLSNKIADIDIEISASVSLFNDKIEFYGEKEKRARKRVQERLSNNRSNYNKKFTLNRQQVLSLEKQMLKNLKKIENTKKLRFYFMNKKQNWSLKPMKMDTALLILSRKSQSRKTWRIKQSKLNNS